MGTHQPPTPGPRHSARYFALLCDALAAQGISLDPALAAAGLTPTSVYAPDATLGVEQFDTLVRESARISGRDDLGFMLGREVKLSSHAILGYGILTSPTLGYAMTLASRFYKLINPWMQLLLWRQPGRSELRLQPIVQLPPAVLRFVFEVGIVSVHFQIKSQLGSRLTTYDTYVPYPEPAYAKRYAELRPARVHFSSEPLPRARIAFDTSLLDERLPMADRNTLRMAEGRCEELLHRATHVTGLTQWVTMMMREASDGIPSREQLARLLHQSPRNLDRRLKSEGTQFLELSKRIRHERACKLLSLGRSATEVAYEVGYRDLANFTRAFRREAGQSPTEYARLHAREPGGNSPQA